MTETDTEMQGALPPEAKDKELKIMATEIQSVVITPKVNANESSEASMGVLDKPLKVEGTELEYIVLAPKGFKGQAPEEKKEEKKEEGGMDKDGDVNRKMEALSAENQHLTGQVNQMLLSRREDLATQIVSLRKEKGLIEEKDLSGVVESFKKLDESQLKILLSDAVKLQKVDTELKAEAKIKLSASGDSGLAEEQQVRMKMFGHKDAPGGE